MAAVLVIMMEDWASFSGLPSASNAENMKLFNFRFGSIIVMKAPFASGTRPEVHPVSRLSIWNSHPGGIGSPLCTMTRALVSGVLAM